MYRNQLDIDCSSNLTPSISIACESEWAISYSQSWHVVSSQTFLAIFFVCTFLSTSLLSTSWYSSSFHFNFERKKEECLCIASVWRKHNNIVCNIALSMITTKPGLCLRKLPSHWHFVSASFFFVVVVVCTSDFSFD